VSVRQIDLNCDLGEDPSRCDEDASLLEFVTSANIACGGHAGDERTMREVVRAAHERGVAIGAHPGFPDRARFGRVELDLSAAEIEALVAGQVGLLAAIAHDHRARLTHVKPHGALYHAAMKLDEVARAVALGVGRVAPDAVLVGPAGANGLATWRDLGFRVAEEVFADRRYEADGSLRSRSLDGALIASPSEAAEQAVGFACGRSIAASDGVRLVVRADTICVHGDTPGAAAVARAVRAALEAEGVRVIGPALATA